ncbi:MAG: hypothetical protein A3H79_03615 [Candidatus Levybacteria bacterium RIFCSPLOWO2_02_FULL_36_8b]|nr:MAG: hypothetical protein A3H79_03615 [Candidatus Levybacteria bacterium RIFCSPLOWO2_02_FULL_36_8b]
MKIILAYATNSGGTYFASEIIKQLLEEKGHQVNMQEVHAVDPRTILEYDLTIFGSNTWNYDNKEGQPHTWFLKFAESFRANSFSGKKFAVFVLGDSSYAQFAGSAHHLESMIKDQHGDILLPALKIDGYYRDEKKSQKMLENWVHDILKK